MVRNSASGLTATTRHSLLSFQPRDDELVQLEEREPGTVATSRKNQRDCWPIDGTFAPHLLRQAFPGGRSSISGTLKRALICLFCENSNTSSRESRAFTYLQALKLGFTVLTTNLVEFNYLLQLIPSGRVLFYRK